MCFCFLVSPRKYFRIATQQFFPESLLLPGCILSICLDRAVIFSFLELLSSSWCFIFVFCALFFCGCGSASCSFTTALLFGILLAPIIISQHSSSLNEASNYLIHFRFYLMNHYLYNQAPVLNLNFAKVKDVSVFIFCILVFCFAYPISCRIACENALFFIALIFELVIPA